MDAGNRKKLRELAEKATPGPWEWRDFPERWGEIQKRVLMSTTSFYEEYKGVNRSVIRLEPRYKGKQGFWHGQQADLDYLIAVHPQAILELLDSIDRLRAVLIPPKSETGFPEGFVWSEEEQRPVYHETSQKSPNPKAKKPTVKKFGFNWRCL